MHDVLAHSLDTRSNAGLQPAWRGVAFRFAFVYWMLFCLYAASTQIGGLDWIGKTIQPLLEAVIQSVANHVLGISGEVSGTSNGSGDKTFNWVALFCFASMALIATILWSLLDRRRSHDASLRELLRVVMRYSVALILLGYGVSKLFFGQFPVPSAARLVQQYGDSSPMGLLWTFMGASPAYVFFSGAGETLGAVLLLFRRTTTLGALVLGAILTNIVMLNLCYDVPVKINSAHYLAMCVYLLLPDIGRLADVLVFHRPTEPAKRDLVLPRRWMRIARKLVKYGLVGYVAWVVVKERVERFERAHPRVSNWYENYWNVTSFNRNGQDVPAILTDKTRWRRLRFDSRAEQPLVRWRFMDDSYGDLYTVVIDEKAQTMTLKESALEKPTHPTGELVLHYTRIDADQLKLEGKVGDDLLIVQLQRFDPGSMLLMTRGFHWISEAPFNR